MRSRPILILAMAILAAAVVAGTGFAGEERDPQRQAERNPLAEYGFSEIQQADCVTGFDEEGEPIYGEPEDCKVDTGNLPPADESGHAVDGVAENPDGENGVPQGDSPVDPSDQAPITEDGGKAKPGKFTGKKIKPKSDKSGGTQLQPQPKKRKPDGRPTNDNPTLTVADYGAAPVGVPNFVIDSFSIPPFLLPIYQACGTQYNIPWQILASINRIETSFGTNLSVSSAGAEGWMQFMPGTWKAYGVDANGDGKKDPYNPVDAICAAARYLNASGGVADLRKAIFAYNHADWYVDEVLLYADQYAKLPSDLIGSLTGLTEGARFPVAAKARYADDISEREAAREARRRQKEGEIPANVANVIADSPTRRGINIYSRKDAPVIAVNDGVIRKIGRNDKLGRFIVLEDAYGNRFTYANLGSVEKMHPVARKREDAADADSKKVLKESTGKQPDVFIPEGASTSGIESSVGSNYQSATNDPAAVARGEGSPAEVNSTGGEVIVTNRRETAKQIEKRRLYALPARKNNVDRAAETGQLDQLMGDAFRGYEKHNGSGTILRFNPKTMVMQPLREGSQVVAGTVLGRIGERADGIAPHLHFEIRPAGRGAPKIDPKPILDGWKLLEATEIYRAQGKNPFKGQNATIGQILLMSKEQLQRRVLNNRRISIYECGREDIRSGFTDRRILALLEYLTARGFSLTITSLTCGHGYLTSSGNVSHHSTGTAVDIAAINGQVINASNQGAGSLTHAVLGEILRLQGAMRPDQLISLLSLGGPSFAMADHDDHIHVGYRPAGGYDKSAPGVLKPKQWQRLTERLGQIENPEVPRSRNRD